MKTTTCPLCEATCGVVVTVEQGRATKVRGDAEDPFSKGFVCPKGTRLHDVHHDPDRLTRPLLRKDGVLVEVDWEEAFAAVAEQLAAVRAAHGRSSVGIYLGNPNVHNLGNLVWTKPLIKALGTPQIYTASTMDQIPRHVSAAYMFGHPDTIPVPDLDRTELAVLLGANPLASNGSMGTAPDWPGRLRALARRGRLVVIDPVRTETAALASEHLAPIPGTDLWLLLSWLHQALVENPREAPAHSTGIEALTEAVRPFTTAIAAEYTGLSEDRIRDIGEALRRTDRALVYGRMGVHTTPHGTLVSWLTDALNAVNGHLDVPGGVMFPKPAHLLVRTRRAFVTGRTHSRVRQLPEVRSEWPVATLADELLTEGEGQLRGLFVVAGNPALSAPDSERVQQGLDGLESLVVVGPYLDETAQRATVVLPPPGPLARWHYDLAFAGLALHNVAKLSPPVLDEVRPQEWEILARLAAIAQGFPAATPASQVDDFVYAQALSQLAPDADPNASPHRGPLRMLDALLRAGPYGLSVEALLEHPHGLDLGPLAPRIPEALSTPSGLVELAPEPFLAALSAVTPPEPSPLLLVGRRHVRSNNSWMHNVKKLVGGRERCTLWLHPDDADRMGLTAHSHARITSRAGTLTAPIELTDRVRPGVCSLPHGWGHADSPGLTVASAHPGVNSNVLTDPGPIDPLSGNASLNAIPVSLEPA